jgi:tetratricopeptide (TPR) repeat protein
VWSNYSTRDAAEFVGLPESAVRSCVREGFVAPESGGVGLRFNFRDLLVLKLVKSLVKDGVSLRRVRRQLGTLQRRLPSASLSELSILAHNGDVVVRAREDRARAWRPDTGQLVFDFLLEMPSGELADMPSRRAAAPEPIAPMTADDWLERASRLEESNPDAAADAYRRALRLRPDCSETLINLGRLYAENAALKEAADCFQRALELDPADATALYNLGVVSQDAGRDREALDYYYRALNLDPSLAEAHYNLATIYDRTGDPRAAIRHINEYRKLTRGSR